MRSIVISAYNSDLSWIDNINEIIIYIYDKSDNHKYEKYENVYYEILPNVGREPHTYFYHIVKYYDNLTDITYFSQDNPIEHIDNFVEIINTKQINKDLYVNIDDSYCVFCSNNKNFGNLQKSNHFSDGVVLKCLSDGSPHHFEKINCDKYWNMFFKNERPDKFYEFVPALHFFITSDFILREKSFYIKIIELLEKDNKSPWIIERLFSYIFDNCYQIKNQVMSSFSTSFPRRRESRKANRQSLQLAQ